MVEEQPLNQSTFTVSQTVLQAPPPSIIQPQDTGKKRRIILIIVGVTLLLSVMVAAISPKQQKELAPASPTPTLMSPATVSQMQQVINQVADTVKQAAPEGILLPPPQVDMEVEF